MPEIIRRVRGEGGLADVIVHYQLANDGFLPVM